MIILLYSITDLVSILIDNQETEIRTDLRIDINR